MILILAVFVVAFALQVWTRLSTATRSSIQARARAMFSAAQRFAADLSHRVFRRRYAYQKMFLGDSGRPNDWGQIVLADLTKFCRGLSGVTFAQTGDGHTDLFRTGVAEGRREVLLHIIRELKLDLHALSDNAQREEEILAA